MTSAQERAIKRIRREAEKMLFYGGADKYEFKEWKIEEHKDDVVDFVMLILEVGLKGDEGTCAAIFCRDRAQLFIGKRGGVTYYKNIKDKDGNYKGVTKKSLAGHSILQAVIDQA